MTTATISTTPVETIDDIPPAIRQQLVEETLNNFEARITANIAARKTTMIDADERPDIFAIITHIEKQRTIGEVRDLISEAVGLICALDYVDTKQTLSHPFLEAFAVEGMCSTDPIGVLLTLQRLGEIASRPELSQKLIKRLYDRLSAAVLPRID